MRSFDKVYDLSCGVEMRVSNSDGYIVVVDLKTVSSRAGFVQVGDSAWSHECQLLIGTKNVDQLITALQELQQFIREDQNDT